MGPVLTTLKVTSFLDVSVQVQHKEKNQLSYQQVQDHLPKEVIAGQVLNTVII